MGQIGIILVGDEILAARVDDVNSTYIIRAFREIGYATNEVRILPDDRDRIADAFRAFLPRYEYVISSGGVGPTHDDVTLEGAAAGFGVPLEENPDMRRFLEQRYGKHMHDGLLRMANVPQGSQVDMDGEHGWPLIRKDNAFLLPGMPRALQEKVDRIVGRIPSRGKFLMGTVFFSVDESHYVNWLTRFRREHPDVEIGSYPHWNHPECRASITVTGREEARVKTVTQAVVDFASEQGYLVRWNIA